MLSITFEPVDLQAHYVFPLEGKPPNDDFLAGSPSPTLVWTVRPVSEETVRLSTGGSLKELSGRARISIGDASPEGKAKFGAGNPVRWGGINYHKAEAGFGESYSVSLFVSAAMFTRILHLAELGRPPELEIHLDDGQSLKTIFDKNSSETGIKYGAAPDGSDKNWDNITHRYLEICWCSFSSPLGSLGNISGDNDKYSQQMPPTKSDMAEMQKTLSDFVAQQKRSSDRMQLIGWIVAFVVTWIAFRR